MGELSTARLDAGKTPEQLFAERTKRLEDAASLKQPDRIPLDLGMGYFPAEIGGISKQEYQDNPDKSQALMERVTLEYQPDTILGLLGSPEPSRVLGDRMTKWPGYGLGPDDRFQFAEQEFMKAEDYADFLEDPADWGIRVYMPRAFSALEGFSQLPPLGMSLFGFYNLLNLGVLASPTVADSLDALIKAGQAMAKSGEISKRSAKRFAEIGFPMNFFSGAQAEAPFDFMSDTLRGMRGIFLDMLRRSDQLLEAEEKVSRLQLKHAIARCRATGKKYVSFPLHRGSDGFMSLAQFERFYWPQLKRMLIELIDNGITPYVFYEGTWNQRLSYLAELPKGKTIGAFQSTDLFKAKEVLGDTMCIIGGMPNSLLQGGTVEEVREHTKRICEGVGKGGGFIMRTAVTDLDGCAPELVKAWVEATREYGLY